jgi:serine/threonine-protein kinase RsbW
MQPQQAAARNGRPPSTTDPVSARSELEGLRASCRRQAHVIDTLSAAVSTFRSGAAALKAENADLRGARDHDRRRGGAGARASGRVDAQMAPGVPVPLDVRAPGAARTIVAECLRGRVAASAVERAQLVVSELVTNSVRHSGRSAADVVIVRVQLTSTMVRIEVEDSGRGGVIAPRPPDLESGGGFGLNVVQALSERWGLERVAASKTRVWAQLRCGPLIAPASADATRDVDGARSSANGKPTSRRAAAKHQRRPAKGTV